MIKENDKILVGFSGGPDSTALLWALNDLKSELKIKLYACHINHGIRKKAADKDEKFSVEFCKKLQIPIKRCKVNVLKYAKQKKISIETAARILRYQVLYKYACKLKCNKIALGHHANDNLETVLLNLVRGTGISGLKGILPIRKIGDETSEDSLFESPKISKEVWIVRPLIELNRQEILDFLKAQKLSYCEDSTNLELGYRRNFLRHRVIPELEKLNPQLTDTVLRMSEILRMHENFINEEVQKAFNETVVKLSKGHIKYVIDIAKINKYNELIKLEVLKKLLPRKQMDIIKNINKLCLKPTGSKLKIKDNLWAWREYDKLLIGRLQTKAKQAKKIWSLMLNQDNEIKELKMIFSVWERTIKDSAEKAQLLRKIYEQKSCDWEVFDKDKLHLPLYVRFRKTQDKIKISETQTKSLKEFFIDQKIPQRLRSQIPLVCDQKNILWIVGSRRAFCGLIDDKTENIIEIKVKKC
ncbi:MAG: tRNA lysidine(34) synthetase TilS [candidate division WOR-3 bacterium]|nr:tRNA lysidine(34) synthetase TilS [candidate division WOR-3 bacterium]